MKEVTTISITSGTIVRVIVWGLVFSSLFYMKDLVVMLLVAVVLASAIEPAVTFFEKYKVPRGVSVLMLLLGMVAVLASIVLIFLPPLADDVAAFVKQLPALLDSVRIFGRDLGFKDIALQLQGMSRDISKGQILEVAKNTFFGQSGFFATTSVVVNGIVNIVLTFVIAIYLALEEKGVEKFLNLLTPHHAEEYIEDLWVRAQKKISLWMQGQFLLSLLVALSVYIPMLILDMPYPALLGILAFFGELIPVVGLTLAATPAFLLAWVHGGISLLGTVALIYFVIGQIEGHVLYPKIMNRAVGVPSVLVIISMLIGAHLAGFWGIVLAIPVASICMEIAYDYNKKKKRVM